jgi:Mn2+/Fe2+ NRAMP family transporter
MTVIGPGIVSGFADNDAGGITTYSVVGARFGYDILWVLLASQIALFVTQEVGARMGLATGHGLSGLIRERFGVRWTALAVLTMLLANLGATVAEFAGIGAALSLLGVPIAVSAALAAAAVVLLLSLGDYRRIQWSLVAVGIGVSVAYAVSAVLARPDWGRAATSLVVPHGQWTGAYLLAVVGAVGTTITPWGQSFIQSYVVDKGLGPEDLTGSRLDVGLGALLTNLVAAFIVVACAATLWSTGHNEIGDASDAARALGPLAGPLAEVLFGVGLLAASLLGLATVPLTSAYATCEAFGWEAGLDRRWRQAPAFYGLLAFFVTFSALFMLIPGLPLIGVMFLAQVFNGLLLPIVLVFVMIIARDAHLMGRLRSGRLAGVAGWTVTALISLLSVSLVVTLLLRA